MPDSTGGTVLRLAAFALVCVAAALTPGPIDPEIRSGRPEPASSAA
jgi:hypothetical protein